MDPQITLYPKSGYYISRDGSNEFFGESKSLTSVNSILYINYQKTLITEAYFIYYALLKLNLVRVTGTATSITINIYIATGEVNQYTGWTAVQSGGALRGSLLNSQTVNLTDDNEEIYIDIYDFAENHIYGSTGYSGIIIEMVPSSGTANMKTVGLYSWDNDIGEKQNPVIQIYCGQTSSSYPMATRTTSVVTENSYINYYNQNTNYSSEDLIKVESGYFEKRGIFKFNLSDIPAGSDIRKAILYLPQSVVSKVEGQKDFIYRILQDWDEDTVTWLYAENTTEWKIPGVFYDDSGIYDSYNMIVKEKSNAYDITKLMQVIVGSFEHTTSNSDFGFMFKGQNITFNSNNIDETAYIDVIYMAAKLNQPSEAPTLISPTNGTTTTITPTFIATINDDNAYGATEGNDLDFRIEISRDMSFSTVNITSFSTITSITGWYWSALGDFSDASIVFPIPAGGYTPGISKVKFIMSETTSSLAKGYTWAWRLITLDS